MPSVLAENNTKKSILVFNSYHKGYQWSDTIIDGIVAILGPKARDVNLQVEYMDTHRSSDNFYLKQLFELYKYKFKGEKFDAIIACDDPAFDFLLQHRNELFPGTPIIFCGVNDYSDARIAGQTLITGVVEQEDIKSTLNVALQLHPNTKNIYVINEKTITGNAVEKSLQRTITPFKDKVTFISLNDLPMEQIKEKVAHLPPDSLILYLLFFQDVLGQKFSSDESISQIAASANAPIYGQWDFFLGHGLIGGMLTNGYYQGAAAASLTARILDGEKPQDIPVIKQSPNKYMFDYNYLNKYNIDPLLLPSGSIVINQPVSNNNNYFIFALAVILGISFLVFIYQRKKAQDQLIFFARTDSLTGMLNRGTGLAILQQHLEYNHRYNSKLTIIFVDVNHLKEVNDTYGHQEGDNLIQTIGQLLQNGLRKSDFVCRFGGDEFLIILPICNLKDAMDIWDKLQESIEVFNAEQHCDYPISVSHGFAEYDPTNPVSVNTLINKADTEMYSTKRQYKLSLKNSSK